MFRAENRWRDQHMDYAQGLTIAGHEERSLVIDGIFESPVPALHTLPSTPLPPGEPPPCVGCCWYLLCVLLLMAWPYRMWYLYKSY